MWITASIWLGLVRPNWSKGPKSRLVSQKGDRFCGSHRKVTLFRSHYFPVTRTTSQSSQRSFRSRLTGFPLNPGPFFVLIATLFFAFCLHHYDIQSIMKGWNRCTEPHIFCKTYTVYLLLYKEYPCILEAIENHFSRGFWVYIINGICFFSPSSVGVSAELLRLSHCFGFSLQHRSICSSAQKH